MEVIVSVLSTAGVTLHNARKVFELIADIKGAPKSVTHLSHDVKTLTEALTSLQITLQELVLDRQPVKSRMISTFQRPLESCTTTLSALEEKIRPYVKKSHNDKIPVWRSFAWNFRDKDIESLQSTLISYKMSFDIAINIADDSDEKEVSDNVRHQIVNLHERLNLETQSEARASYADYAAHKSDSGFALKRWLLDTETAIEDMTSVRNLQATVNSSSYDANKGEMTKTVEIPISTSHERRPVDDAVSQAPPTHENRIERPPAPDAAEEGLRNPTTMVWSAAEGAVIGKLQSDTREDSSDQALEALQNININYMPSLSTIVEDQTHNLVNSINTAEITSVGEAKITSQTPHTGTNLNDEEHHIVLPSDQLIWPDKNGHGDVLESATSKFKDPEVRVSEWHHLPLLSLTETQELFQSHVKAAQHNEGLHPAREETVRGKDGNETITRRLTLDLSYANIGRIPESVCDLIKVEVERLALAHNQIWHIPFRFLECEPLRYLNLRSNMLREISPAIYKLPRLEILDIGWNKITRISKKVGQMTSLRILSIIHNRVDDLPNEIHGMERLQILKIAENPLRNGLKEIVDANKIALSSLGVATNMEQEALHTAVIKKYLEFRSSSSHQSLLIESNVEQDRKRFGLIRRTPHSGNLYPERKQPLKATSGVEAPPSTLTAEEAPPSTSDVPSPVPLRDSTATMSTMSIPAPPYRLSEGITSQAAWI